MYQSIAAYYDFIFPLKPAQIEFATQHIASGHIFDIGCATGNLAVELARLGYSVTAIDMDVNMIHLARAKSSQVDFRVHDMTNLEIFPASHFDGIVCFGNTVVHLLEDETILDFFTQVQHVLKPDGVFLMQILNYDKILSENLTELPLIDNEYIRFQRSYTPRGRLLDFETQLMIKAENRIIENTIQLYPITQKTLVELLRQAGFQDITCYGDFQENPVEGLPLVIECIA